MVLWKRRAFAALAAFLLAACAGLSFLLVAKVLNDVHEEKIQPRNSTLPRNATQQQQQQQSRPASAKLRDPTLESSETDSGHLPSKNKHNSTADASERDPVRPLSALLRRSTLELLGESGRLYTDQSACGVARWRLSPGGLLCSSEDIDAVLTIERLSEVRPYDTVFVDAKSLKRFVGEVLPWLGVDVVVLTQRDVNWRPEKYEPVLTHQRVLHMFTQNPWKVHPNMSGIPTGIGRVREGQKAVDSYRNMFQTLTRNHTLKQKTLFASYLSQTSASRQGIPSGPRLKYPLYVKEMAMHRFVLSPNGDRPDCKRTWEAIGLGTVPITQLNPQLYEFMKPAGVIFDYRGSWKIEHLEAALANGTGTMGANGWPIPNSTDRRMVFEEFWMDWMERVVGHELGWRTSPA